MIKELYNKAKVTLKEYQAPIVVFLVSRAMVFLTLLLVFSYGFGNMPSIY